MRDSLDAWHSVLVIDCDEDQMGCAWPLPGIT